MYIHIHNVHVHARTRVHGYLVSIHGEHREIHAVVLLLGLNKHHECKGLNLTIWCEEQSLLSIALEMRIVDICQQVHCKGTHYCTCIHVCVALQHPLGVTSMYFFHCLRFTMLCVSLPLTFRLSPAHEETSVGVNVHTLISSRTTYHLLWAPMRDKQAYITHWPIITMTLPWKFAPIHRYLGFMISVRSTAYTSRCAL